MTTIQSQLFHQCLGLKLYPPWLTSSIIFIKIKEASTYLENIERILKEVNMDHTGCTISVAFVIIIEKAICKFKHGLQIHDEHQQCMLLAFSEVNVQIWNNEQCKKITKKFHEIDISY
jgi:hypothetical protein